MVVTPTFTRYDDSYKPRNQQLTNENNNEVYHLVTELWPNHHKPNHKSNTDNNSRYHVGNNHKLQQHISNSGSSSGSGNTGLTALVSFPGSGNTWLRYLIQQATGLFDQPAIYSSDCLPVSSYRPSIRPPIRLYVCLFI